MEIFFLDTYTSLELKANTKNSPARAIIQQLNTSKSHTLKRN